jgi:hypothetical protein
LSLIRDEQFDKLNGRISIQARHHFVDSHKLISSEGDGTEHKEAQRDEPSRWETLNNGFWADKYIH